MQKVKEKRVELIELFYDLIYVYAISRLTELIEFSASGGLEITDFLRYLVLFFVILQAWLYLTNYVNRYGKWKWYEYGITVVNMIAAIYLSNTISVAWEKNYIPFNIAMMVMLLTVTLLYYIKAKTGCEDASAAWNSIKILLIVCGVYVLGFIFIALDMPDVVIWADVAAVLLGAFLPFFIRGKFDASIISFPHLVERFELLTIITFGESVVGMTGYFDIENFTLLPILIFAVIITMFGSYVVQIHCLMNHNQVQRALPLMFSHYFIVIAVNLVTIGIHSLQSVQETYLYSAILLFAAEEIFYYAMMRNRIYYRDGVTLSRSDTAKMGIAQLAGLAIILAGGFVSNASISVYVILAGMLWISGSGFAFLLRKNLEIVKRGNGGKGTEENKKERN